MIKFRLTHHSIERLQERFPELSNSMPEIKNWKRGDSFSGIKKCFSDMLSYSEENKTHLNNSQQMIYLYEKYGFDKEYIFMELRREDLVFVLKKDRSEKEYSIATVFEEKFNNNVKNKKYKNARKKDDLEREALMREIDSFSSQKHEKFNKLQPSLSDFGIQPQSKKNKSYF